MTQKILAIIPARGGSKTIPRKNLKLLHGKPLIAYTIESALDSELIERVLVSTEDLEIATISKKYGAEIPFIRSKKLAEDDIPILPDVIRYTIKKLKNDFDYDSDIIVVLPPTVPLRKSQTIDEAIKKYISSDYDWITTLVPVTQHPYRMQILEGDKIKHFLDSKYNGYQRQEFPLIYYLNGSIHVTSKKIINSDNLFNCNWGGLVIDIEEGIDIDNSIDFILVEALLANKLGLNYDHNME